MTGYAVWDEATRPVAPTPPDAAAPSRAGTRFAEHLVDVHDHLRGELRQIRELLRAVTDGGVSVGEARASLQRLTMRQHDWNLGAYCAAYCVMLTQHHGLEDHALFPQLGRAEPGLVPVLDRLRQEHAVIHELVTGVDRALVRLARQPDDLRELREAVDQLGAALLSHLTYEEEQILAPLARHASSLA